MTQKTVSIIIPVRNQPKTLDELLTALDAQQCPPGWEKEVVVIDNNSTDNTRQVIESHDAVYILETQLGPSIARNTGAAASVGELLWFIDADAVPLGDDFLRNLIATADELGDFGGFGGPILLPRSQRNNPIAFADHMACWSAWHAWRPTEPSGFQPTSFVVRREVFERTGPGSYRSESMNVMKTHSLESMASEDEIPMKKGKKLVGCFRRGLLCLCVILFVLFSGCN